MTKSEFARLFAKQLRVPKAQAADRIDQVVNEILIALRRGEEACIPGLGTFRSTDGLRIEFDSDSGSPAKAGRGPEAL